MSTKTLERKRVGRSRKYKGYRGRLQNGRIGWKLKENCSCMALAKKGFSLLTIADHTGLTVSQVVYRLKKVGLGVRDYRNGETHDAQIILDRFKVVYSSV